MSTTFREHLSRAWQSVSNFLLTLDSGGATDLSESPRLNPVTPANTLNFIEPTTHAYY